ncbi:MAG TPA: hypothetical protein VFN67_30350 [Polyangiales bacterium]|nr:hypothetical protein [Polyangiales bacterium]
MKWHHWAFLLAAGVSALPGAHARANTDTTRVRDSTLLSMRRALSHYDVSPCATAAQLGLLAQYAEEHAKEPDATEALFLRAAVAADLAFIAEIKGSSDLNAAVAQNFGGDPTQLTPRIIQALQEVARGVYKEPANAAIKALRESSEQPGAAPGARSDALLIRRAITEAKAPNARERFAALGQDPCAAGQTCTPDVESLDLASRKALWYLTMVAEAEKRLEKTAKLGDQLAEAVLPILRDARKDLPDSPIQFLPDVKALALNWPAGARLNAPAPVHHLVFVSTSEISYATPSQARIGAQGTSIESSENVFPNRKKVADLERQSTTVKPIPEWVNGFEQLKGENSNWSVGIVPAAGTPAHLLARVMVSLAQAGAEATQLLARSEQGQLTGVPMHVVFAGLRAPQAPVDLTLRVRMGGYVLRMGDNEVELSRTSDNRYDVAGLGRALSRRRFQTAGLSFVADVPVEILIDAVAVLPPSDNPVQLLLRAQL